MEVLPTFTPDIQISVPIEVETANHQFRRDNSAIDMVKGVVGADNSRRASRLRRQRLKTTARLTARAGFPAASIGNAGEYIRPSSQVAAELRDKVSPGDKNAGETSALNGGNQGWKHARVRSYGSLNAILKEAATASLLGATDNASDTFDTEHDTTQNCAKAAVNRWNKWMKIYIGFLIAVFLAFGVLIAIGKAAGGNNHKKATDGSNDSVKSSAGTSTEAPSFWYTVAVTKAVGLADLVFCGSLGELYMRRRS